jgi:hypothetical protein
VGAAPSTQRPWNCGQGDIRAHPPRRTRRRPGDAPRVVRSLRPGKWRRAAAGGFGVAQAVGEVIVASEKIPLERVRRLEAICAAQGGRGDPGLATDRVRLLVVDVHGWPVLRAPPRVKETPMRQLSMQRLEAA